MHRERPATPTSYETYSSLGSKKKLSTIQSVLQEARATIHNPSRPYTPRDINRKLFAENEYSVRPQSAYSIGSSNFDVKLTPLLKKPLSAGSRRLLNIIDEARKNDELDVTTTQVDQSRKEIELSSATIHKDSSNWRNIKELLAVMSSTSDVSKILESADSVFHLLDKLEDHNSVDEESKEDPSVHDDRRRIILYTISKLMDHTDPNVLMKLSAIILRICPEGLFLLSTCKLLFKLSKVEQNDTLFREEKIVQLLADILHKHCDKKISLSSDIMIYTIATLKNVSCHPENQRILLSYNIIAIFSSLLKQTYHHLSKETESSSIDQHAQLLVQLTATLRNIAVNSGTFKKIAEHGVIQSSIRLMYILQHHSEFIHNTSRVLSKISMEKRCKEALIDTSDSDNNRCDHLSVLKHLLMLHKKHKPIVIRLCFVLGNLTYSHAEARTSLGTEDFISFLLELLCIYNKEHLDMIRVADDSDKKKFLVETEDLLLKLVRLIANISLNQDSAISMLNRNELVLLLSIIERLNFRDHEELILNIVRSITNFSFYRRTGNQETSFSLFSDVVRVAQILAPMVSYDHDDAVYESVRAYGNLSQHSEVRRWMATNRIDEVMVLLLSHKHLDVVQSACGVLINLTSDPETNHFSIPSLKESRVVDKIFELLDHCQDTRLFDTLLKTIHNLILVARDEIFSEVHIQELSNTLPVFLKHLQDQVPIEEYSRLEQVTISLQNACHF